jgi:hypothetical protein
MVGGAGLSGAHFVQHDGDACLGDLPSGFGASDAAADDMDRCVVRHSVDRVQQWGFSRISLGVENGLVGMPMTTLLTCKGDLDNIKSFCN